MHVNRSKFQYVYFLKVMFMTWQMKVFIVKHLCTPTLYFYIDIVSYFSSFSERSVSMTFYCYLMLYSFNSNIINYICQFFVGTCSLKYMYVMSFFVYLLLVISIRTLMKQEMGYTLINLQTNNRSLKYSIMFLKLIFNNLTMLIGG